LKAGIWAAETSRTRRPIELSRQCGTTCVDAGMTQWTLGLRETLPMETVDPPKVTSRLVSVSSLIGWLSLCLLAAAWGRTLDEHWQHIWAYAGVFGLAAAVGLGGVEKAQLVREKYVRDLASRMTCDGRLARLNRQSAALEMIDEAIRLLINHVAAERQRLAYNPARGTNPLPLSHFPLEVIPIKDDGKAFDIDLAPSIAGSLHAISSRVVSFEHDEAFTEPVVLLTFKLGKCKQLCFVVNVLWTRNVNGKLGSSGAVVVVGVPADQVSDIALAKAGEGIWAALGDGEKVNTAMAADQIAR
jgi:hypothetical protein